MKWIVVPLVLLGILLGGGIGYIFVSSDDITPAITSVVVFPSVSPTSKPRIYEKYALENLKTTEFTESSMVFDKQVTEETAFTSYIFHYTVFGKKVTGLAHVPTAPGTYPVIIMFRGFVDREVYESGVGTRRAGEVLAKNGFITLAPDFLGYGRSDMPSIEPLEERFQTYTAALTLLASISQITEGLEGVAVKDVIANVEQVGIWGHSNGGHIAQVVLEVTGKTYPITLWAPVSKPFPYSILYYTDEYEDHGKMLRRVVADFEKDYDVELYSPTNYYDWINAPIILHQGTVDDAVPVEWSNELNESLTALEKDITYYTYPGDDHNFAEGSWDTVVARDIAFFRKHFQNHVPE